MASLELFTGSNIQISFYTAPGSAETQFTDSSAWTHLGSTSLPFTLEEDSLISFTILIPAGQIQVFYIVVSSDSNRGFRQG